MSETEEPEARPGEQGITPMGGDIGIEATAGGGVISVTQSMTNTNLPDIVTVGAAPIASVVGHRAPAIWQTKGWTTTQEKANISTATGGVTVQRQPMEHTSLTPAAPPEVIKLQKTIDIWGTEGWTPISATTG